MLGGHCTGCRRPLSKGAEKASALGPDGVLFGILHRQDILQSEGNHPADDATVLREVATLFLKLGTVAFGGPAAHIAMFRDEVVRRRRWVSDEEFLDLLGATNLIPGPNSTEMAIHLGFRRAGWPGLLTAGVCFIGPAVVIVLALAWAYVRFGTTPQAAWLLYGVKPVIIAIVLQALLGLGRTAVQNRLVGATAVAVLLLYLWGASELLLLFGGGAFVMLVRNLKRLRTAPALWLAAGGIAWGAAGPQVAGVLPLVPFTMERLFLIFLKIGAVLYGSGYVLIAFLRRDLVERLGWLSDAQLLDAIAVGQITPGPVFTTATFVGYLLGGTPAALLATVGIFLPSFVFVAASGPLIPQLRKSPWAAAFLDGVNASALALMAGVTWQLARSAVVDVPTGVLAVAAIVILLRFRLNSAWLILAGAAVGWGIHAATR